VKLLANENVPLPSVAAIQQQGHDIVSISLCSPGVTDEQVLAAAHREGRIFFIVVERDTCRRKPLP
jgi:hypothetical protein